MLNKFSNLYNNLSWVSFHTLLPVINCYMKKFFFSICQNFSWRHFIWNNYSFCLWVYILHFVQINRVSINRILNLITIMTTKKNQLEKLLWYMFLDGRALLCCIIGAYTQGTWWLKYYQTFPFLQCLCFFEIFFFDMEVIRAWSVYGLRET